MPANLIYSYEKDPYRTELDVRVLTTGNDSGRPFAVLDDTILYPEGGGQPSDHGRLGAASVVDVQRVEGKVRHYLDGDAASGNAALVLDWERRYDHMQQHTAQHLLTAVALGKYGWWTTAFHLRVDACDIEVDAPSVTAEQLTALEDEVAAEIRAAHPVTARRVTPEEMVELEVRTRGLPAGHQGDVRLVTIEGIDVNTCGGTHVRSTHEIEILKLVGTESLRGGTRLHWLAGGRVRRRLGAHEARNAELRKILGTSDEEFIDVTRLKLEQLKNVTRHKKALEGRLALSVAEGLALRDGVLVEAHFDDADMGFLQQVARRFTRSDHAGAIFLTASGDKGHAFMLAAGGAFEGDLQVLGRRAAEILGGRGGGSGELFQGKAESLEARPRVVEDLAG